MFRQLHLHLKISPKRPIDTYPWGHLGS